MRSPFGSTSISSRTAIKPSSFASKVVPSREQLPKTTANVVAAPESRSILRKDSLVSENSTSRSATSRGKPAVVVQPSLKSKAATPLSFGTATNVAKSSLLHQSKGGAIGPRLNSATAALARRTNSVDRLDFSRKSIVHELHVKVKPGDLMERPSVVKAMANTEKKRYRLLKELQIKVPAIDEKFSSPSVLNALNLAQKKHDEVLQEFKTRLTNGELSEDDDSIVSVFAALAIRKSMKFPISS